jgi:hypothetical protein
MLYAYLGAGVVEFDDVVLKEILPASPSDRTKRRRPSLESKVTTQEIEGSRTRRPPAQQNRPADATDDP